MKPAAELDDAETKRLNGLKAEFCLEGHEFFRTDERDGPQRLLVARWGRVREVRNLDEAAALLRQIRGAA